MNEGKKNDRLDGKVRMELLPWPELEEIAKSLGMDAQKLNRKLKEAGILYNQSGQWLLKQPYASWGLHATRTQTYTRSDGSTGTSTYTVWTEKGKRFIVSLMENGWNVRKAIKSIKGEMESVA